ncbi:MAG: signal peptidase I [Bacillota bacterium]
MTKRFLANWGRELFVALLLALVIRAEVAEARKVPTPSMAPTVLPGDRLLAEKLLYRFTGPKRGDIVVFSPPFAAETGYVGEFLGLGDDYLKRVIALPGETVEVRAGRVLIDGVPLEEPYLLAAPRYTLPPMTVPEGRLFVLGDNRNHSYDSHLWGLLDAESVHSRAVFRFWPLGRIGPVD